MTFRSTLLLAALVASIATGARAESFTVTVDETDAGTVSDGIIDGFPELAAKDGVPDFGGNALSVALKSGVTELRGVVEFPLAELAGVAPSSIAAATLTFNIDDVLSTFGPGTDFNGQASDTIYVHLYEADGVVEVSDYNETKEARTVVSTGPAAITDATLNASGAVTFTVDIGPRLAVALANGAGFLGVVWRTDDSPTGTSLDNLGEGSAGPPGARNSRLPFLTIEVDDTIPPPECECGDGVADPLCGEQCDDANVEGLDGCGSDCRYDTVLGGTKAGECLLSVALGHPIRDGSGAIVSPQVCRDGDACDADATAGVCGFTVAACVGMADPRLPACSGAADTGTAVAVLKPASRGSQATIRERLEAAVAATTVPGCSAGVDLTVPLRTRGSKQKPGKAKITLRAKGAGGKDKDTLVLVCEPAS